LDPRGARLVYLLESSPAGGAHVFLLLPRSIAVVAVLFTVVTLYVGNNHDHHHHQGGEGEGGTPSYEQQNIVSSSYVGNKGGDHDLKASSTAVPPPLESILHGKWNVMGDASWLLDFAIVGFPKCGTSTLMFHLRNHPEIFTFKDERCDNSNNQQAKLIRDLYTNSVAGNRNANAAEATGSERDGGGNNANVEAVVIRRGIKCPIDLENTKLAMPNYQKYFPKTNYIVGIRHPVRRPL